MASKNLKKYERHFLIGLVVLLLASFSITGALGFCHDTTGGRRIEAGGTFEPKAGQQVEIGDAEFVERYDRQRSFLAAVRTPTLELYPFLAAVDQKNPFKQAWMALAVGEAAEAAGYRVGPVQLTRALHDLIGARSGGAAGGGEFTNAAYQQFLVDEYRGGTQAEFEAELERMLMRDAYLAPLVLTTAYAATYEDLFEEWRKEHVKLDLEVIGLPAGPFAEKVEAIERTRSAIADASERLELVSRTARTLRLLQREAERRHAASGSWPADMEALAEGNPGLKDTRDTWDNLVRYTLTGDEPDLRSAGPDGEMDTDDDVTLATVDQLSALAALQQVGEALVAWHNAAEAWPADLAELLVKPKPDRLAPLAKESELDDPWGSRLTYVAPDGEKPARLTSAGPDGAAGTPDDLGVEVPAEGFAVAPQGALVAYVGEDAKDTWGHDLDVSLSDGQLWSWRVTSRGPDGEAGTDDDVTSGNRMEMQDAYQDPVLRREVRVPERRRFELVYVHLPLLSDDTLKALWERFPDLQPQSEGDVWTYWRTNRDTLFMAEDPADPVKGYGAARMQEVAPDAPRNQVPGPDAFPVRLGAADAPPEEIKPDDPDAELRKIYRDQGWRGIALRDLFVERVMAHLLERARKSSDAVASWEKKFRNAPEGTDVPQRPEVETFGDLYAKYLADLAPSDEERAEGAKAFVHHVTNELVTDESWESNPDFGTPEVRLELNRLKGEDRYASIPTQIGLRTTKAIVHGIQYEASTVPPLEDVREQVFARHLEKSRMDYAAERLEELKKAYSAEADAQAEGAFDRAVTKWQEGLGGATVHRDQTGWFLGHAAATQEPVPEDASDEEKARLGRINTALRLGYATVGRTPGGAEDEAAVGSLGRTILRDDDSGTALLVRVTALEHAGKAAFSPSRYVDVLRRKAYGERPRSPDAKPVYGAVAEMAKRFFGDFDWFRSAFDLRTNSDLDALMQR